MTCAKQTVRCTLILKDGRRFVGTNACANPQTRCPRAPGEGYEKCHTVCGQYGHAEDVAVLNARVVGADLRGARAYVEGHTRVCDGCLSILNHSGAVPVIGPPPP